jgi:prepilin-type N-terminal cleavage/methylation domain-containing protein/prepilin-type processing-associated H-X9-DG protein
MLRVFGGFTLTELLIVVALVALLLSLVIPVFHAAREKAATLQCLSNLRSVGLAIKMFADQHQGWFPEITDSNQTPLQVRKELEPYSSGGKVFECPRDPLKPRPSGGSYDWRFTDDPNASLSRVRLDEIHNPSFTAIGGDRHPSWHKANRINVLFADLHVEQIGEESWFKGIKSPMR